MITIPTIQQLYTDLKSDLENSYGDTIPAFGKNFLRAISIVIAGVLKLFYLAIGGVQKNIFVDTADPEAGGGTLERFGRIKLNRNPFPAKAGQYSIQITGSVGATIQAQTTFKSNDDSTNPGKLFILDADFVLPSSPATIIVRALEGGLDSQLFINEGLTATIPIPNVNKDATVTAEVIQPLAPETIEDYRSKAIAAYRTEPQGGAASDYRLWSADAQGVERVYPYPKPSVSSELNLYVEATIADSSDGKGTPTSSIMNDVAAVVEFDPDTTKTLYERGRRPIGAIVHVLPVTIISVDIRITSFSGITTDIQTLIFNAVKQLLSGTRPFIAGSDLLADKNDIIDTNKIIATILNARPGSIFASIDLKINSVSMSTYTFIDGNIPYLNSITYV